MKNALSWLINEENEGIGIIGTKSNILRVRNEVTVLSKIKLLSAASFGSEIAEDEAKLLVSYFVETNIWKGLQKGETDIIYGAKGSGKSALYSYLLQKEKEFREKQGILLIPAEELTGAPAFKQVFQDADNMDESKFRHLWYLYILTLVGNRLYKFSNKSSTAQRLVDKLHDEGLLGADKPKVILTRVKDYVIGFWNRLKSLETSVTYDPITGAPTYTGRINLNEPTSEERELGIVSVLDLIELTELALKELNLKIWILFDRLDVAFSGNLRLEKIALRSLFRVYNDLRNYERLKFKIFIRNDLWERISDIGFREASHIRKQVTITWNKPELLYLIVSRVLENNQICRYCKVEKKAVLANVNKQDSFFYKVFPDKVEVGRNPETLDWIISRVRDGLGITTPREVIQLINAAKEKQIRDFERGVQEDTISELIGRAALKDALTIVSKTKVEQTIYAEYPELKPYLLALSRKKTRQTVKTLSEIFHTYPEETLKIIKRLIDIGFLKEEKGATQAKTKYWVPFIFRSALEMVQGTEEPTNIKLPKAPSKPAFTRINLFEEEEHY